MSKLPFRSCEISSSNLTPPNLTSVTIKSRNLSGRGDMLILNQSAHIPSAPVIILLHGVYASNWAWQYSVGVEESLKSLQESCLDLTDFVVVMPSDGLFGDGSAYLPILGHGNYEKWITEDVIAACMHVVKNVDEQSSVYIAGFSMGGFGALRLGIKYPMLFKGISVHSAVTQLDELALFIEEDISVYWRGNEKNANIAHWLETNRGQLPPLRFDCGLDDPLINGNRNFVKTLNGYYQHFQYEEFSGGHDFEYWAEHIKKTFLFFDSIEKKRCSDVV